MSESESHLNEFKKNFLLELNDSYRFEQHSAIITSGFT